MCNTVQTKLSLRSKAGAGPVVFGPATLMANLCPTEVSSKWVFEMGEPKERYEFDVFGNPDGRPAKADCKRFVAQNFYACAHFFQVYFAAFNAILLGWPLGDAVQKHVNCLFGAMLSVLWAKEESGRRGCHTHGVLTQPFFQVQHLRRKFADPAIRRYILAFGESLMKAYMPSLKDCDVVQEIQPKVRGPKGYCFALIYYHAG